MGICDPGVGCIAGAIPVEEYRRGLAEAGFAHVEVEGGGRPARSHGRSYNSE